MEEKPVQDEQSWLYKIGILPKYIGEFFFGLIGKNDASATSKFILGYMLVAGLILLVLALISPETLKEILDYLFK